MRLNSSLRTAAAFGVLAAALAGCSSWPGQGQAQGQAQGQGQGQTSDQATPPPMHRGPSTGAGFSGSMGSAGSSAGPGAAADVAPGQMGPGMGVEMMQDQQQICDVTRNITHANSPEERQSLMDKYFAGMAPQSQEQHLQMMMQQCSR